MGQISSNLFAEPSLLEGFARAWDLGGTLNEYNFAPTGELADFYALWGDWRSVGDSLRESAEKMRKAAP